jgi:hypothetical protein
MGDFDDITGRVGLSIAVQPHDPTEEAADLDAAVQAALTGKSQHVVISPASAGAGFQLRGFGPEQAVFAPPVAAVSSPNTTLLTINGGERVYVCSDPTAPNPRWVDVPGLNAFYRLPDVDRDRARNAWADRLSSAVPEIDQATARALPIPQLRTLLAHHGAKTFVVKKMTRGVPPVDAGAIVNGITLPTLRLPLREPDCYLPVIAAAEGKLESINAWDAGAGVSLGVIQFNADSGALFRFLWQLWADDPDLFGTALTEPLGWTMIWDGDHPDLVFGAEAADRLHGRGADKARNAAYLQTGKIDGTGRNGPYRRKMAGALRDCVVWPHVQDMVEDVSSWYLKGALKSIQAEGIGPLDTANPDHDTFVLTAMLLSGRVRYSSCLGHVLTAMRKWKTTSDKLSHWPEAVAATTSPCPTLATRLKNQQKTAGQVYDQVIRLLKPVDPV